MAIKKFTDIFKDALHSKRALREISILRQLKHSCVVKMLDIMVKENDLLIVLEFAESDLRKLFKSGLNIEMVHIKTITYNVLLALKYLHSS